MSGFRKMGNGGAGRRKGMWERKGERNGKGVLMKFEGWEV